MSPRGASQRGTRAAWRVRSRWRAVSLLATVAAYLSYPAQARAHDGHDATTESWFSSVTSAPASMALVAGGIVVGAIALRYLPRGRGALRGWTSLPLVVAVIAMVPALVFGGVAAFQVVTRSDQPEERTAYEGVALNRAAPDFALTDQRGSPIQLSGLRGRVVLLAFLDPRCTDICPLTALHLREVAEQLELSASEIALLAVNVNPDATSREDVAEASTRWGNGALENWHFLTATPSELEAVRAAYGVLGGLPKSGKPGEVAHSPGVYVIDQSGMERWYVSVPEGAALQEAWDGPPLTEVLTGHVRALLKP